MTSSRFVRLLFGRAAAEDAFTQMDDAVARTEEREFARVFPVERFPDYIPKRLLRRDTEQNTIDALPANFDRPISLLTQASNLLWFQHSSFKRDWLCREIPRPFHPPLTIPHPRRTRPNARLINKQSRRRCCTTSAARRLRRGGRAS